MGKIIRRKTRTVKIGRVLVGSGHPVAIQSMVKVPLRRLDAACEQILSLEGAGCEIIRAAIENKKDAGAIRLVKSRIHIPLVADIHFDYRLALSAIEAGVDKVRLNPGNIFRPNEVRDVIAAARQARVPLRIGANSGSLRVRAKDSASALVKSVRDYLKIFEKARFSDIVISLKGSGIMDTIDAYRKMARLCDYPLHLGITATGLPLDGVVKSSLGIGVLLFEGIGDTIRASLLDRPQREIQVARLLLNSLGIRSFGPEFICCPTCGRCEVDLQEKARSLEAMINSLSAAQRSRIQKFRIAVMGCVVNGPGEAKEADLGIAFSKHKGVIFKKGRVVATVSLKDGEKELFSLLRGGRH
jgi:(E)-4-hydroxy-3-methylbut-2-enyl-diphosphate synthase